VDAEARRLQMSAAMRTALVLVAMTARALADDWADGRTPRLFYVGVTGGIEASGQPDPVDPTLTELGISFVGGANAGFQIMTRAVAVAADADALPAGNIYRTRGSIVLGVPFTLDYREPCLGPPGYTCNWVYPNRHVRSIAGLKLGAEVSTADAGQSAALEVGLAMRSQLAIDLSFVYDPIKGVPGGAMDFYWHVGPFYLAMEVRGLASYDEPVPFLTSMKLGYAPAMW
jgi:hypothetical protein